MKLLKAFGCAVGVVAFIISFAVLINAVIMWLVFAPAWVSIAVMLGVSVLMFTALFYA